MVIMARKAFLTITSFAFIPSSNLGPSPSTVLADIPSRNFSSLVFGDAQALKEKISIKKKTTSRGVRLLPERYATSERNATAFTKGEE